MIVIKASRMTRILMTLIGLGLLGLFGYNLVTYLNSREVSTMCSLIIYLPVAIGCLSYAAGAVQTRMDAKGLYKRGILWIPRFLPWQAVSEAHIYTFDKQTFVSTVSMLQTFVRLKGDFGDLTIEHSAAGGQDWMGTFLKLVDANAPHINVIDERTPIGPDDQKPFK